MATPVTLASILKIIQSGMAKPEDVARNSKLGAATPHKMDFTGSQINWSVPYAGLGGGSHDAATAEANDQNGRYALFTTGKAKSFFKKGQLDGQLTRQALAGSVTTQYVAYVKGELLLARDACLTRLWNNAYNTSTGRRGLRGSLLTNATLKLATLTDVFYFNIGDKIVAAQTDGGALRNSGSSVTITAVNTSTGVLTAVDWTTITGFADGDSLYALGDENKGFHGLGDYNPTVAPSAGDSVFGSGVDRSVEPEMLSGVRYDTTGQQVDTCLIRLIATMENRPGWDARSYKVYANGLDVANLKIAKEGQRFVDSSNQYQIGVEGFRVGDGLVVADPFCPEGTFRLVADGAFELHTIQGIVVDETDGNQMRKAANDTYYFMELLDGDFTAPKPYQLATGAWPIG